MPFLNLGSISVHRRRAFYRLIVLPLTLALLLQMWPVPLLISLPSRLENEQTGAAQALLTSQSEPQKVRLLGPRAARAQTPALEISKSAPTSVNQGELLLYTLHITNTGDADAAKVVVTDTIPSLGVYTIYAPPEDGTAGVTANSDGDWYATHTGGTDYIRWGTTDAFIPGASGLPQNGTATLYFYVRVAEPVPDQTVITNMDYAAEAENVAPVTGNSTETSINAPRWAIDKSVSSATIQPGEYLTYTIMASNEGHLAAAGLYTITDVIPEYTTLISYSPAATQTGNTLTWAFSETLSIGASRVVSYVVQVSEPLTDGLSIVNENYSVKGANVYTGAVGTPVQTAVNAPVLEVTKTDDKDVVWPGGTLTYTLSYSNSGSAVATGVVLTDTLDENTTFVGSLPPPTGVQGSARFWNLGNLPAGNSGSIIITVTVKSPLMSGTVLTNMATIASSQGYSDEAMDATTVQGTPVLHLVKEASSDVTEPGNLITYTLSYSNSGDAPAVGVRITDTIDANTIFQGATPGYSGNYVWVLSDPLWPSDTHQITLTVRVVDSLTDNTILTNNATIWATGNITDADQALVTVESAPILRLVKQASKPIINPGDTLTYTIWYSNTGNAPASGVVITDVLPPELHGVPPASDQQQVWGIGDVQVGGPYSVTLKVSADDPLADLSLLTNQVTMSSVETTTLTASETVTVHAVDLVVNKTASPTLVKANEYITYTLTVMNNGHAAAEQVRITDTLPAEIVPGSVISSASPGVVLDIGATSPPRYVWTTPTLNGQSSINITISGRVVTSPWSAGGDIFTNTVEVSSDDSEVNWTNNSYRRAATGRPGVPYTITLTAVPTETVVGDTVPLTAALSDAWGNPAYNGEIVSFQTSLGTLLPNSAGTLNGTASSSLSSQQPGVSIITVTAASNIQATTSVTFNTGVPHHFVFSPTIPSSQKAGVPFDVTILVADMYGNVVPTYTTSAGLADLSGTMSPTSTGTSWSGGVWNGSVTITGTLRNNRITASDGVISGTSNLFDVQPGPADQITLDVTTPMPPCGATSVHTATLRDSYGNLLWAGTPITFSLVAFSTGADLVPSSPYVGQTNDAGMATATVRSASHTGSVWLYADIDGGLPDDMGTIVISGVGSATDIQIEANPSSIVVGNTSTVTVTLQDCLGQPVPGSPVNLALSGLGSLAPSGGTTNASGVFTSTFTAGLSSGTVTLVATSGSLWADTSISISGGPIFAVIKTAEPAPGATVLLTQTITYFVVVTNTGTAATNFSLTDAIPSNSQYVPGSASASGWANLSEGDPLQVTAANFSGSGQVLTLTFAVTPIGGGSISNQASIESDQTAPQTSNVVDHSVTRGAGEGRTVFLPIILKDWGGIQPGPTNANLIIKSIGFVGGAPSQDGDKYHIQVVIQNAGTESVTNAFWVDLYLNPASTPTPNQPWQNLSQSGSLGVSQCPYDATCYGRAWFVTTDLGPGDTVTLSTQMPPDQRYDRWPAEGVPYVASRHNPIMALVDSWGSSYGAIYENDETDNLSTPISGAGAILLESNMALPTTTPGPAGGERPALPVPHR